MPLSLLLHQHGFVVGGLALLLLGLPGNTRFAPAIVCIKGWLRIGCSGGIGSAQPTVYILTEPQLRA
jgi:hypothetical protein